MAIAAAFAWIAITFANTSTHLSFTRPFEGIDFGKVGMFLFIVLIIYATANAVNLTDGLDGLAAGSSAFTFAAFMIIAFTAVPSPDRVRTGHDRLAAQALDQAVVAAAMFGACAGFLWWNAAPAKIFMGDTGSLAIGGAMAGLAMLTRTDLLLLFLAGLPLIEALVGHRAGDLVPRLPAARATHGADPSPLRGRWLVGVHGDRALLALRRHLRRARHRLLLRRLPPVRSRVILARRRRLNMAHIAWFATIHPFSARFDQALPMAAGKDTRWR